MTQAETTSTMGGRGLCDLRIVIPDARSSGVRRRVAICLSRLAPDVEAEALAWIESVSEFDEPVSDGS